MASPVVGQPWLNWCWRQLAWMGLVFKVIRAWKSLQVSYYGGRYSIHRLLALDEYTRGASLYRVLLICATTAVPTVVLVLIQESIPLQDPTAGWRENYGFWIRAANLAFVISLMVTDQTRFLIDGVVISRWRLVLLSLCASGMFTVCATTVAAHFMFPIPFFALTMAPIFYPLMIISYRIVVGGRICRHLLQRRDQFVRYITFVCTEVMIAAVYAAYEALFRLANGSRYQILVILLLPIIKVAAKNAVLRCMAHMEDLVPEAVIFTVDFFNAIYIATCMQSATSDFALTAIAITELSQTTIMLYGLHKRTLTIMSRLRAVVGDAKINDDLVTVLCLLCRSPEKFNKQVRADVRVASCFPQALSDENKALLDKLAASNIHDECSPTRGPASAGLTPTTPSTFQRLKMFCARNRIRAVHQIVPEPEQHTTPAPPRKTSSAQRLNASRAESLTRRNTILRDTLHLCQVKVATVQIKVDGTQNKQK